MPTNSKKKTTRGTNRFSFPRIFGPPVMGPIYTHPWASIARMKRMGRDPYKAKQKQKRK